MRYLVSLLMVAVSLALATGAALADRRVALVVGNWDYHRSLGRQTTIENDARDMAAKLRALGYEVVDGYNLDRGKFAELVRGFQARLSGAELALVYYAGHGVQADASNYIVPVDVTVRTIDELRRDAIDIGEILTPMAAEGRKAVLLFDSYNDVPLRGPAANAGISAGFGIIHVPDGSFVATAAQPDKPTYTSSGRNSHFTGSILGQLEVPRLNMEVMMLDVRREVERMTGNLQRPWINGPGAHDLVLNTGLTPPPDGEIDAWNAIVESERIEDFERFLERYPDGLFAPTAREKIRLLTELQNRPDTPPLMDRRTLVLETQRRLIEIGCLDGRADGAWGRKSRQGLENYARERNLRLVTFEPTEDLLGTLREERDGRVCPVVCAAREELVGERCVLKTCPAGRELDAKGACVAVEVEPQCGRGEELRNGRCRPVIAEPVRCRRGEELRNGRCRPVIVEQPLRCGPGEQLSNGRCVRVQAQPPRRPRRASCSDIVNGVPVWARYGSYDYCTEIRGN